MKKLPKVVLIGRANVGKSTLFNRLTESSVKAIVSDIPGTTRDRKEAAVFWRDKEFTLIDTGGLNINTEDPIELEIVKQAVAGLEQSDLVLFVVDAKAGLNNIDKDIASWLRKSKAKTIVVANKTDTKKARENIAEFYSLGLDEPWPVSAANGSGTGDLLDFVITKIGKVREIKELETIKVAIVGKPNAGKSSLINSLLKEERAIVSDKPHTTRDSQDIELIFNKQSITLIDTAGIRRRTKQGSEFEKQSVAQSLESIQRADVVVLMTEAHKRLTFQDKHIAESILETGASVILVGNKWDLLEDKSTTTRKEMNNYYRKFFSWLAYAPLIFMSAKEKNKTSQLLKLVVEVYNERHRFIEHGPLQRFLKDILKKHKPARGRGAKHPYIYELEQVDTNPPKFIVKMNYKGDLHFSYPRFIENNLRYKFGFTGTPIKIRIEKVKIS